MVLDVTYLRVARFLPTMKLEYKPGRVSGVADTLSSAPLPSDSREMLVLRIPADQGDESLLKSVSKQQRQDKQLDQLIRYVSTT